VSQVQKCNTASVSFSACRCSLVVFSSKLGREEKKESGDRSVNGYLWLWLACLLLSACCCWRCYYADLWGELSTHLAQQATSFLLSKHTGEGDTAPAFSGRLFVFSSHGRWVFPHLLWSFPPFITLTNFPAPGCWACTPAPLRASLASPGLFIYSSGKDFPLSFFRAQGVPPSLPCVFIVLIAYYSVSLFSLGRGQSFQGAMLIWPRVVCGSTASSQAVWVRVTGGPGALLVSLFNVKWRFSAQAGGVEGSKFCLFSVALPARCISSVSPRFHCRRHTFCFLPLAAILESLHPQYSLSILCACCFNDNMSLGSSILVKSVWCPEGFLYLNGHNFL
jgi:hypothetical protein